MFAGAYNGFGLARQHAGRGCICTVELRLTEPVECGCVGRASSSLANVSAISTTHINDTALTIHRDTSAIVPQSSHITGRQQQQQPVIDLDSIDLAAATREPFLDGCRVS